MFDYLSSVAARLDTCMLQLHFELKRIHRAPNLVLQPQYGASNISAHGTIGDITHENLGSILIPDEEMEDHDLINYWNSSDLQRLPNKQWSQEERDANQQLQYTQFTYLDQDGNAV
jgi:hypothetical protein